MHRLLKGVLKAYRPLYQRGVLIDGPHAWPSGDTSNEKSGHGSRPHRRMLLVALTGWRQALPGRRSEP